VYLIITLPFDVARSRTLWLDGATKSVAAIFTSAVCLKVMILILEAVEKRSILLDRYRYSSPEVTSGIYSRSFFWWLNNLMTIGFRRVITHQDLYPIDDDMTSQVQVAGHMRPRKVLTKLGVELYYGKYHQPSLLFSLRTLSCDSEANFKTFTLSFGINDNTKCLIGLS
jgi:hypothetical protein